MMKFRKLNSINPQAFSSDVKTPLDDLNPVDLLPSECLKLYRSTLTTVLNTHAPEKTGKAVTRSKIPWFNDSIVMAIRLRHMAECNWANHCQTLWHSTPSIEPDVLFQISWMQLKTGSIKTHLHNTRQYEGDLQNM